MEGRGRQEMEGTGRQGMGGERQTGGWRGEAGRELGVSPKQ